MAFSAADQAFVQAQIDHCLGNVAGPGLVQSGPALELAMSAAAGGALYWKDGRPTDWQGWQWVGTDAGGPRLANSAPDINLEKHEGAIRSMCTAGLDFDAIIDMQDRRNRVLRLDDGTVFPVFSFHRRRGYRDRIIWPLPVYQDIEDANFLGQVSPDEVPWDQKISRVTWRGIPGGRAQPKGPTGPEGHRLGPVIKKLKSGEWDLAKARSVVNSFPRHRFVEQMFNDPRADVGLIDRKGFKLAKTPLLEPWGRPRMTRQEMQKSRYLAVIRGNDLASNFFWTMNSGSLGLVMDTPFESFAACHFRPNEHYLLFQEDMSDFDEVYDWAEAHPKECQEMTRRAAEVCRQLARTDLRDAALRGVISRLGAAIEA